MKKLYTLLMFIVTVTIAAQAPQGFNYQATVRNNAGALIINKSVSFKFNIIPTSASGTAAYSESQTVTTDDLGQVSLVIGKGTATTGTFANIDWGTGTYYLGIELNTGNGFVAMGATQLLSVPYALYAKNAGGALPIGTEKGQILYWNGTAWVTLAPGTDGSLLRVTNGVPTFSKTIPKLIIKDHLYSFLSDNTIKLNVQSIRIDTGGDLISKKGIVLSTTNGLPTIADDYLNYDTYGDLFSIRGDYAEYDDIYFYSIGNLQPNTTYYIRTYAENEIGIAYSNLLTFTTPSTQPTTISLSKPTITDIKASTFTVQSNIQAANNSIPTEIFASGYVVSKSPNPTISNSKKYSTTLGYDSYINELDPNTTYYVKSFLTNSNGTAYSEEATLTTLVPSIPSISSLNLNQSIITQTDLRYPSSSISSDGGSTITQNGFVWSTSPNPSIALTTKSFTSSGSSFNLSLTGLLPDTTYYVRAFATNATGTGYSEEKTFKTLAFSVPSISNLFISSIASTGATISGSINNGGSTLTQNGIVWSTSPNPNIASTTKSTTFTSSNNISASMSELLPATTYYVRAFATNTTGTGYSEEINFTTLAISAPQFSSFSTGSVTQTSASANGSINNEGGSSITQKGIVWSTSQNPTIALTTKSFYSYSGNSISNSITGLLPATTYYVRAFATNATGTGYSQETSFTTLAFSVPTISSLSTSGAQTSISAYGTINYNGGSTVIQKGIVWSTSPNPTIALTTKISRTDSGNTISEAITGLLPATTYYVRAFATNDTGTGYSEETTFKTLALAAPSISSFNIDSITQTSTNASSYLGSNGGSAISQKGFVWSTSPNPTIALTTKSVSTASGTSISSSITGLSPATTYYIRAFATNALGTSYSLETSFTTLAFSVPTISSFSASSIYQNRAYASSTISFVGGPIITQKGFVWSTNPNPTIALTTKNISTDSGSSVSTSITGLLPATTYYLRAFATNSTGTGYSPETSFTTLALSAPSIPSLSTYSVTQTSTNTSIYISSDGGATISQKGIVWSTNSNPTIALTTKSISNASGNSFNTPITGLSPETTYFARAFATNSQGTTYSLETSFTTLAYTAPSISNVSTGSISQTSASASSSIYNDGGSAISQKGFVWSTSPNPTVALTTKSISTASGNSINASITGLLPDTIYYLRAFATNTTGTGYSEETTFTTLALAVPTISYLYTNNISQTSVQNAYSDIDTDGGSTITQKGFVWSTSPNPTIALTTKTIDPNSGNSINLTITGLLPATTYYVRAFATNTSGTGYGPEASFTTLALTIPSISSFSTNVNNLTQTSIPSLYGPINSDGGSAITQKGYVWSTNPNPTIALTTKTFYTDSGDYIIGGITGLLPATTYYVRAFATNALGTAYSPEKAYTTLAIAAPTISSFSTSNVTQTSVSAYGSIGSDGGASITQKGFVWSTSSNPTIALTTKSISTASGDSISSSITGLSPATTYYLRAFATNALGTSYSLQTTFTTNP
jgi:hypothetical protein